MTGESISDTWWCLPMASTSYFTETERKHRESNNHFSISTRI